MFKSLSTLHESHLFYSNASAILFSMQIGELFTKIKDPEIALPAALATVTGIILIYVIYSIIQPLPKKIRRRIKRRKYISLDRFFDEWAQNKKDFPGCYVILIYDKKVVLNPLNYDDIYIGQSVHVRHRVFSHLTGHGNGDVYYGRKSGCKVYIIITKCHKKKLNKYEKDLIAYFDATSSLNVTRGGAIKR